MRVQRKQKTGFFTRGLERNYTLNFFSYPNTAMLHSIGRAGGRLFYSFIWKQCISLFNFFWLSWTPGPSGPGSGYCARQVPLFHPYNRNFFKMLNSGRRSFLKFSAKAGLLSGLLPHSLMAAPAQNAETGGHEKEKDRILDMGRDTSYYLRTWNYGQRVDFAAQPAI